MGNRVFLLLKEPIVDGLERKKFYLTSRQKSIIIYLGQIIIDGVNVPIQSSTTPVLFDCVVQIKSSCSLILNPNDETVMPPCQFATQCVAILIINQLWPPFHFSTQCVEFVLLRKIKLSENISRKF